MLWGNLPLIEMDEYEGTVLNRPNGSSRSQDRAAGERLEKDIGRQLSQLREQSRNNKDDYRLDLDPFGRDVGLRKPSSGNDRESGRNPDERERDKFRRMDRAQSPHEWRKGRDSDMDRGYGDQGRDRNRDRSRDWGRDEQRRRPRDYGERGDYSDGSEDSWDGGRDGDRERYRDHQRDRGWDSDRYRDRRDRERDYRDRDYRDRDYRDRDYRDRDYRDRDDRDWRRDRWEEKDDSRRRDYRERQRSDEDGQWSDYHSRDRYHDDRDYHRREFHYEEPSEIVILKGLPSSVEDSQIHELLAEANLAYKDVRIVKNREGFSRGFAFVEFLDVDTAKGWIESCKGKIQIEGSSVLMDFSRSKSVMESHKDWTCGKCGTQNFSSKRRNTCFSCNAPKDENDEQKDIGQAPCKVLILRGLDTLTTEETIRHCLSSFTSIPIFDVRLIKDKMTNTSRGFCFIELGSIEEATKLLEEIQNASFKIDEKAITVSYARFGTQPPKPSRATGQSGSGSSSAASSSTVSESSTTTNQSWPKNNFAANAIAQAHAAAKMGNTAEPTAMQIPGAVGQCNAQVAVPAVPSATVPGYPQDPSLPPAVPAQPVQSAVPAQPGQEQSTVTATSAAAPQAMSSYVYDAASGYYYDTSTRLYYDPNTQYYYNAATQQYMYWDATTQQYVAVVSTSNQPPGAMTVNPNAATATNEAEGQAMSKEKQKKAKTLSAKKIAKDMERWAKKLNVNKEAQSARPQVTQSTEEANKETTYQYDPNELKKTGVKMSFVGSTNMASVSLMSSSPLAALSELDDTSAQAAAPTASGSLVAEYGADDDSGGDEETSKEDNFTDWTKIACLLCKRQFPSKEALTRHNQFSDLHKQNLQIQKKLKMSFAQIDEYERQQREAKYRDRAKERRELFGQPDSTPSGAKRKRQKYGKIAYEQPTKDGITSDNIGNKMLQAMGWTQGTGLGKDRQGIVAPISAKMRNRSAGLGLEGSDYGAMAGDSERDMLKKMAQSRYDTLE